MIIDSRSATEIARAEALERQGCLQDALEVARAVAVRYPNDELVSGMVLRLAKKVDESENEAAGSERVVAAPRGVTWATVVARIFLGFVVGVVMAAAAATTWYLRSRPAGVVVRVVGLPAGRKLVGVSWRDGSPWVLTRPAFPGEGSSGMIDLEDRIGWKITREVYRFQESELPASRDAGGER